MAVDLTLEAVPAPAKTSWSADDLLGTDFPEPKWAVPDLICEGLNILSGRPKSGKSYLVLQVAGAVGLGGVVLGRRVARGKVLYLALEDNPRRLKKRMRQQLWDRGADVRFETSWPMADDGGTEALTADLQSTDYSLAIIDTVGRFFGVKDVLEYGAMTDCFGRLQRLALATRTPLIGVAHHNKALTGDAVLDTLGSTGIAGAADAILGLYHEAGAHTWKIKMAGRDIDESELEVKRDCRTYTWQLVEQDGIRVGTLAEKIVNAVDDLGGEATATQIATATGLDVSNVHGQLGHLTDAGVLVRGEKRGREVPYSRLYEEQ